jgi:hypothetical protein
MCVSAVDQEIPFGLLVGANGVTVQHKLISNVTKVRTVGTLAALAVRFYFLLFSGMKRPETARVFVAQELLRKFRMLLSASHPEGRANLNRGWACYLSS